MSSAKHDKSTAKSRTLTHLQVTDEDRVHLETGFIERIAGAVRFEGESPPEGAALFVWLVLPGGLRASCTFEEVDSKRAMVSLQVMSPVGEDSCKAALTKGDLTDIPFRKINKELTDLLDVLAQRLAPRELEELFGPVGVSRPRQLAGRLEAPTRSNSSWPRLLLVAKTYSELAADRMKKGAVHQAMVDKANDGKTRLVATVDMSRKKVKEARDAGFLMSTGPGSRGAELTGLAKFLIRMGFPRKIHKASGESYDLSYGDQSAWVEAVEEYYTTDNEERWQEQWEEQWEEHLAFAPQLKAEEEASRELEAKILAGDFDEQDKEMRELDLDRTYDEGEAADGNSD